MHQLWLKRSLILSLAAILTAVACGTSSTTNAGSVKVMATWTGAEQASFMAVMKPFTDSTGITIQYEASRDQDALLTTRVAAGNPPDLAAAPSPTLLTHFAKTGKVIALNNVIDMSALQSQYSPGWISLGEPLNDGKLYEVYSWVSLKGLIWYDPKNFQAKGYNIPNSWASLLNLQQTIKSGGTTPWCIALESGSASGWPGSDWVKEIVLSQSGPTVYDAWWQGKQKWTSPEIKLAWQTWGHDPRTRQQQRLRRSQEHGRHQLRRRRHADVPEPAQVLHAQPGVVHHQLLPERQRVAPAGDRLQLLPAAGHHLSVRRCARRRRRRVVDVPQHPAGAADAQVPSDRSRPGDLGQARRQDLAEQPGQP